MADAGGIIAAKRDPVEHPGFACDQTYQIGHELGHVVANSSSPDGSSRLPRQWLE